MSFLLDTDIWSAYLKDNNAVANRFIQYAHRILISEREVMHLDQPVCVDPIVRGAGFDKAISVGRFLRGPRRLSDEKVRQLLAVAGGNLAHRWLEKKNHG